MLGVSLTLRLDGPNPRFEPNLPEYTVYALKDAAIDVVWIFTVLVQKVIRSDVVQRPNKCDPSIRMRPPIQLLVTVKLFSLLLAQLAFIRVEKLHHIDLLSVLKSSLQRLMVF